jgi:Bifunctional DNA primase/polymerase, N-terminal/Domain of unknown function (DUF927)
MDAVLEHLGRGWKPIPLEPGDKLPFKLRDGARVPWADLAAPSSRDVIKFWDAFPDANVGIVCGPSGLHVVDIDDEDAWSEVLADEGIEETATLTVRTGRGRHLYYQAPQERLGNRRLALGVDTRGEGGYVVAPGSSHSSGAKYLFEDSSVECVPLPEWIVRRLRNTEELERPGYDGPPSEAYGQAVLAAEVERVRAASEGERNDLLFRAACNVFEIVNGGHIPVAAADASLFEAARTIGLDQNEIEATLHSARSTTEGKLRGPAPATATDHPYLCDGTGMIWLKGSKGDIAPVRLTNFGAAIVADRMLDDGELSRREFEIVINLHGETQRLSVAAEDFDSMQWVAKCGAEAIVEAGYAARNHARAATQHLSGRIPKEHVYLHTGWRKVDGVWVFLDASRARLPGNLERFVLGDPGSSEDARASLRFLDVAPDAVTIPLFSAIFAAPLGPVDFSLHLHGKTGLGKSTTAALAQQHFGADLDDRHLPANWSSTANAIEEVAFLAKDVVLVIDEFTPTVAHDVQQKAERIFRAEGNGAGRARLNQRSELIPERAPRALIISTGEELPDNMSLRARLLILGLEDQVDWDLMTACQNDAANGRYAASTAGYVAWLAPQLDQARKNFKEQAREIARSIPASHRRTASAVAQLYVAFVSFLDYATSIGAIDADERSALNDRAWTAFMGLCEAQASAQRDADIGVRFISLLGELLAANQARLAPFCERDDLFGTRVGWIDDDDVYLLDTVAFEAVKELAERTGQPITASLTTLRKSLRDSGKLASTGKDEGRDTIPVRKTIGDQRRTVLHLNADALGVSGASPTPLWCEPDHQN